MNQFALIIQGPYSDSTLELIIGFLNLKIFHQIILSTNSLLSNDDVETLNKLSVEYIYVDFIVPKIFKYNSNNFMHYNNQINGIKAALPYIKKNCKLILKIRSDLSLHDSFKFKNAFNKFLYSSNNFLCTDITSRDFNNNGPIYHLCDWVIGEKVFNQYSSFYNLKMVDELEIYSYWRKKNLAITRPDLNQKLALEQIIWMSILSAKNNPLSISEYSKNSLDEFKDKLNQVLLINLSQLGLKSTKYLNAHLPQFGRLRSARFNFIKNKLFLINYIVDFLLISFFEALRSLKKLSHIFR